MKGRSYLRLAAQILVPATAGYLLHAVLESRGHWSTEDLNPAPSFSEVENAKAALRKLCYDFIDQGYAACRLPGESENAQAVRLAPAEFESARRYFQQGLAEFQGTEQELLIARALLGLFRANQDDERWLDLFLDELRRRPMDGVLGRLAVQAVAAAQCTGRERQLLECFDPLSRVPFDFPGKEQIQQARAALVAGMPPGPAPALCDCR